MKAKKPKLTLKSARALATKELGTAAGLVPHENNNSDYQRYEMQMGNNIIVISNVCGYWDTACVSFGGKNTYYDISTLQENYYVTDAERRKERNEVIRDAASCNRGYMIKALLEAYGLDVCRNLLEEEAKKLSR